MTRNQKIAAIAGAGVLLAGGAVAGGQLGTQAETTAESQTTPGFTTNVLFCNDPNSKPEDMCMTPEPAPGNELRVPLISCGVKKAYVVDVGRTIRFVNTGTVTRYVQTTTGIPMPTGAIVPGDWFDFTFFKPGKHVITVRHNTCTKPYAQLIEFTVT